MTSKLLLLPLLLASGWGLADGSATREDAQAAPRAATRPWIGSSWEVAPAVPPEEEPARRADTSALAFDSPTAGRRARRAAAETLR